MVLHHPLCGSIIQQTVKIIDSLYHQLNGICLNGLSFQLCTFLNAFSFAYIEASRGGVEASV